MLAYLRRHHIGLLALFIALGGTSYAAAKLPRNSVGTTQLKAGAVTEAKLAQAIRDQLNRPAVPGAPGAPGPKGDTGPAGPTSGGVGGTNTNISVSPGSAIQAPVTVTLTQPGKVLVLIMGTFSVRCTSAGDCDRTISATVGGTTVPGAFATINGDAGVNTEATISSAGVLTNVPAGTPTVSLANQVTGPSNGSGNKGDVRIVAVALG